jgi:glutathione S-transferase
MDKAIFYSGTRNASSWAMRAWLALRAAEFPFEEIIVDIRRPQRLANLKRIAEFSPSATVPALVTKGKVIFDSLAIMEFANEFCGGRLLPEDPLQRARARSFMAWQHAGLSAICSRISFESAFYPYKRRLTETEQAEVARFCSAIDPLLAECAGPYLFGSITLADFALAPAAIRLRRHKPDLGNWPRPAAWMDAIIENPFVNEWRAAAGQLPHIWFDDYLIPGSETGLTRCDYGAGVDDVPRKPPA